MKDNCIFCKNMIELDGLIGDENMSQNTSFQEKLYSMTTLINAEYTYGSDIYELSASGFFYAETKPSTDENEKGMVILDKFFNSSIISLSKLSSCKSPI